MRFTPEIASVVLAATSALAAPSRTGAPPASAAAAAARSSSTELCDSWDEITEGQYTIYQNNWGASSASSGSQCTTFDSISGTTVAWSTSWSWSGGSSSVKSYSNVALESVNKQLSAVSSIPSTWEWSYTGTDIVADVSYDLWLAPTSGGTNAYEVMVWLAALGGAGPISSTGSAVATTTVGGHSFELYSGPNGDTTVYSFVATESVGSFSGDVLDFLSYLVDSEGVPDSYYITSLQAGTEPFTGSDAVFSTSAYSMTVE